MANGDNIHIAVKGRGGMKEGDPPNEKEMLDTIEKNDNESSKKEELVGPLEQCDDTQEHIDISEETHQGYLTGEDEEKTCNQSGTEMDKNDTQEEKQGDIITGDGNENSKEKNMPVNSTDTDPSDEYKQGDPLNEEGLVDHSDEHKQGDPAHEGGLVDPPDECNQCESANKVDQGDPLDEYKEGGPAHQKDQRDIPDAYKQDDHVIEEGLAESPDGYKQSELANKGKVDPSDEHKQDDPTPEEGLVDHSDECNQSETAHKEDQDDPPDKYKQGDSATEEGRIDPPHAYTEGSPAHQMDQGDIPDAFKQDDYVHEEGQVNPPDEYQQGNHAHEESQTDTLNECKQGDTVNEEGHVDPDSEYKKANHDHKEGLVDPSDGYTQRELVKKEDQADPNDEYKQGDHDRREGPVDPTGDDRPTYPHGHTAKVKISSPLKSTFAQGSEVFQARLIAELGLEDHFPDKLTYTDVMSINDHEKEEADTLEDIPRLILRKLIMLDFTSRENDLDKCLTKMSRSNEKSLLTEGNLPNKNFIKKYKEYYMSSCPECFSAEFIPISDKGKNISLSEIKKATLNKMGTLLCDMSTRKTLHDMCTHARIMGLFVDEDLPACKRGIELANTIYDEIRHCDLVDIKSKFTPLQKDCWKMYTDAMKEFFNPRYDLREKDQLKQKMESQRKQQWYAYINGDPFMKHVIGIIFELDGDELVCFLDTLKFNLDEKSRTEIPFYRQRFAEAWDTLQTKSDSDKAQTRKNFDKAEQHLSEASFGIEHIFREIGQIYVASLTSKDKEFGFNLAKAVARSITLGYPFELMDGDVANVPLEWIDGVFKELKSMLNNERVLSLSILGLQSSGEMRKKDWKFDETEMKEFPKCILEHIDKFNHDTKNGFTLLGPYKARLVVHVFGRALPLLKKLDSEYRAKHSMKTKLNNHKKAVWDHFKDVVAERSATMIASNRFCEVISVQIEDKVRKPTTRFNI
ncbi:uncharacterized protein LOC117318656 [Pecten maximus]|uniref:uncharacterized protein LOC117318656 n=1 Tax=Pecten maximus TaxID=6579 RepID=UPI0014581D28|nr:uncharacterized protein LOC117318656 [Pecten maximus]